MPTFGPFAYRDVQFQLHPEKSHLLSHNDGMYARHARAL